MSAPGGEALAHILVVDDDREIRDLLGRFLARHGCRPAALRRALTNLIDNAVKYGQEARVTVAVAAENIEIRIDDRGPGIPASRQEDAFKPFHRLEASRSRETGGTGLGLTVARTILRALGGDVTLANRPECGLRVVVRLPR